jgi:hypothetical protein
MLAILGEIFLGKNLSMEGDRLDYILGVVLMYVILCYVFSWSGIIMALFTRYIFKLDCNLFGILLSYLPFILFVASVCLYGSLNSGVYLLQYVFVVCFGVACTGSSSTGIRCFCKV